MSKSFRLFIIISFLACALWFIYPTMVLYFFTSPALRDLVLNNVQEIDEEEYETRQVREFKRAKEAKDKAVSMGLDIRGGINVLIQADFMKFAGAIGASNEQLTVEQKEDAIDRIMHKIQSRIDAFGVAETVVRKIGEDRISVQIPGVQSFDRFEKIIETAGILEFKLVDEETMEQLDVESETNVLNPQVIPKGSEILYIWDKNREGKYEKTRVMALFEEVYLTGKEIQSASVNRDEFGQIAVGFELTLKGSQKFAKLTGENQGKRLAIVLDGRVMSAPTINARIFGSGMISGNFTFEEAKDLSLILKSGSLPVPIQIVSKSVVGPTMGKELLEKSFFALILGVVIVISFMLIWYRFAGIVACLALFVNGWMIFAILAQMHFTITLPGIAGLILTMGMAIDANIIIFERIKEEYFKEKRDVIDAIQVGYGKAFWSIFDANLTTIIAALILSYYGSGVIEGFAFTLLIGILVSMFTALFMTRFIFESLIYYRWIHRYSKLLI